MTKLSPAAQATWCAYEQVLEAECVLTKTDVKALAAALRAAADQFNSVEAMPGAPFCRNRLLTIANELENIDE